MSVAVVLLVLVLTDPRVRTRLADLAHDPIEGGVSASEKVGELGGALWVAARDESVENTPLLTFVVVGAGVLLFMLRS